MARLQSVDHLMRPAVAETIRRVQLAPEDAGAVELALHYADAIDEADTIAAQLDAIEVDNEDTAKRINALAAKVEAVTTLDKLGPKLLAVLESLGATPRGRAALRKEVTGAKSQGKLDAIRAARRPA